MNKLSFAIAAAFVTCFGLVAASAAQAGGCPTWVCGSNSPHAGGVYNGVSENGMNMQGTMRQGTSYQGRYLNGRFLNGFGPGGAAVVAVTLPSGETIDLR